MARKSKGFGELINQQGKLKMSDTMKAFVKPYWDETHDREGRLKLLSVAVIAWNLTLSSADQQRQDMENMIREICGEDDQAKQDMREILEELMARKRSAFANIRRYIVDFELRETHDDVHLSVVSAPMPENRRKLSSPDIS
ncbi:hypothetical protein [Leptolyngbya ohadii]|uniref:hypothetical protein n=1 Tax=Leptolyngbya ohadii TaxID=1962290 RepID=UPI00117A54EE|nr:hypothetical protein [Leptolyngbya ohadii]